MKNVTIELDDELHRLTRLKAEQAGKSISEYVASVLEEAAAVKQPVTPEGRERLAALQRIWEMPTIEISENGRMPNAEERNARR